MYRMTYLVCIKELSKVVFEHCTLGLQILDIARHRFGGAQVVQLITSAQIEFDEPCCQHHPLSQVLRCKKL
jgi:hypothetical protein